MLLCITLASQQLDHSPEYCTGTKLQPVQLAMQQYISDMPHCYRVLAALHFLVFLHNSAALFRQAMMYSGAAPPFKLTNTRPVLAKLTKKIHLIQAAMAVTGAKII